MNKLQVTILRTLQKALEQEHEIYVNLADLVPKSGGSFADLQKASESLQEQEMIEIARIEGRNNLLLAKITSRGTSELDMTLDEKKHNWNLKVEQWIKYSIMGAVSAFLVTIMTLSIISPTQEGAFQADITQEKTMSAEQTLLEYLGSQGVYAENVNIEKLIELDNEIRFLVLCTNTCEWKKVFWVEKHEDTWFISHEENVHE